MLRVTVFEFKMSKLMILVYFCLPIVASLAIIAKPLFSGDFGYFDHSCGFKIKRDRFNNPLKLKGVLQSEVNKLRDLKW
jgi:hypothetical protein